MSTTFKSTVGLVNPWRGQLRTDLIVLVMLFFCFVLFCFLHGSAIPLSFESVLICHIKSPLSVGNIILNPRISHQLYCTLFKTLIWLFHSRCLEGYVMDTTVDTFTCQKDGHWFPETISCSPKKCPLPANITRIRVHGDDFSVNKQVSVSCEEGYIYEGVNISTCQVRFTALEHAFVTHLHILNVCVSTQAVFCSPEKKNVSSFQLCQEFEKFFW